MNRHFLEQLKAIIPEEEIFLDEPMKNHTTFRIGGNAEYLITPDRQQLKEVLLLAKTEHIPITVIGNGSNLLVRDAGICGLVIEIGKAMSNIRREGNTLTAEAGVLLSRLSAAAAKEGLSGLEFASGIPGSLGGAVVMNAGAYGGEMKQVLLWAKVLTADGEEKVLSCEELDLSYRHSCIPENAYIVTEAAVELSPKPSEEILARMEELKKQRIEKQPLEYPSAGSTFKRPEGYFAGKLISDAGLRGYRVGGAQVSEKHCGFVVNAGGATAADVEQLMRNVSDKVREQFSVELEPEVKIIGE
jgi:UDP-N-acetylmuramate dehydrogenase